MPKVTFIRHQQQKNHDLDPEIIDTFEIPKYDYDIIICSPYLRCRQTAFLFSKENIYVDVRLSEYRRYKKGNLDASTLLYPNIPLDENWTDFTQRVDDFCDYLFRNLTCNALIITHGIVIRYLEEKLIGSSNYKRGRNVPFMSGFTIVY